MPRTRPGSRPRTARASRAPLRARPEPPARPVHSARRDFLGSGHITIAGINSRPRPGAGLRHHEVRHKLTPGPEPQQRRHPCASLLPICLHNIRRRAPPQPAQQGSGSSTTRTPRYFTHPASDLHSTEHRRSPGDRRQPIRSDRNRPNFSAVSLQRMLTTFTLRPIVRMPIKDRACCLGHDRHSIPFCQGLSSTSERAVPQSRGLHLDFQQICALSTSNSCGQRSGHHASPAAASPAPSAPPAARAAASKSPSPAHRSSPAAPAPPGSPAVQGSAPLHHAP